MVQSVVGVDAVNGILVRIVSLSLFVDIVEDKILEFEEVVGNEDPRDVSRGVVVSIVDDSCTSEFVSNWHQKRFGISQSESFHSIISLNDSRNPVVARQMFEFR